MNVLYLIPAAGFGGAERQGVIHIRWLRKLGHRVTTVVGRSDSMLAKLRDSEREDTVWLDDFPPELVAGASKFDRMAHGFAWLRRSRLVARLVEQIITTQKIDVIVANRTFAWVVAAQVCRRTRCPFVIRAGSRPRRSYLARALSLLEVFEVEPVLFVSNCRAVEESYRAYLSVPRLILPNAVDLDEFRSRNRVEACERLRLDSHRPRIAMAIRPSGDKGINLLCKIAKEPCLAQSNVEFVIAGEYPERGIFMAEIARRGLADVIKFLGHLDDVAELYAASDVVLLTSPSNSIEGSPNAILEAMACSKPVVATAVGGVPELVRDSVEGFLVSETDPSSGAFAIERLLSDAKLRENMGSAGRVRAENEHAPDSICRNLVTTIYRCIGSSHTVGGLSSAR